MPFDFPDAPNVGDQVTIDGIVHEWDGVAWSVVRRDDAIVTSVHGRVGDVVGLIGDYSAFYPTRTEFNDHVDDINNPHMTSWDDLLDIPTSFPPSAHTHLEVDITDLDRMRWRGEWATGNYKKNDVVLDDSWLMVANQDTSDRAAPIPIDPAFNAYQGAGLGSAQALGKQIIFGNRYEYPTSGYLSGYSIETVAGNQYTLYMVLDPEGTPKINQLISFEAGSSGWQNFSIAPTIVLAGEPFDIVATVFQPDPSPIEVLANYNYITPNNPAIPITGEIQHDNKTTDILNIHKTDDDGTDQSAMLLSLSIGDTIDNGVFVWAIQSITDNGTYVSLGVSPATQTAPDGVRQFIFQTVAETPITYGKDTDYWTNEGITVQGIFGLNVDYSNVTLDGSAYGTDIVIQQAAVSDHWDPMAYSGGALGGGEGGEGSVTTIGDTFPDNPIPGNMHFLTVAPVGLYIWYDDGDSVQWVQTNGGGAVDAYVQKSGDTMDGGLTIKAIDALTLQRPANNAGLAQVWNNENGGTLYSHELVSGDNATVPDYMVINRINPADGSFLSTAFGIESADTSAVDTAGVYVQNTLRIGRQSVKGIAASDFFLNWQGDDTRVLQFDALDFIAHVPSTNRMSTHLSGNLMGYWVDAGYHFNEQPGADNSHAAFWNTTWGSNIYTQGVHIPGSVAYFHVNVGGQVFSMQNSGIGYAPGGWQTGSSSEVKSGAQPIVDPLGMLDQLAAYRYRRTDITDYHGEPIEQIGLFAQDVEKIAPMAVSDNPDPDDPLDKYYDPAQVLAVVVAAIKELRIEVEALKNG